MNTATENKNKYAALGFTLGFHAVLFLLFILIVFITPIPPFEIKPVPEIEIGLGMEGMGENAGGSGNHDKDIATSENAASNPVKSNDAANVVTDPNETESVNIKVNKNNKTDSKEEVKTPEEEKASSELMAALTKLKSKHAHDGKGEGDKGTGGSGNGTSTGVGDGKDPEEGNGNKHGQGGTGGYDLKGRMLIKKPDRLTDANDEGIVVVEIIVDETGKVVKATPGQRGSTTTSSNLYAKARQAAYQAKFNASPDGAKEQHGTYTFVFTLE